MIWHSAELYSTLNLELIVCKLLALSTGKVDMLLSVRAVNHKSLRDEQQLNLAPAYDADRPAGTDWPAVPVVAVFGANASGKSNLIDAISYIREMAVESDRRAEPGLGVSRSPFLLDPETAHTPSWYDIDAVIDGVRHTYGFATDDEHIVEEWLHRYPHSRKQIVFERTSEKFRFGTRVDADLQKATSITPENALFLSTAARSGQSDVQAMYRWLRGVGTPSIDPRYSLTYWLSDTDRLHRTLALLSFADLGIADLGVEEVDVESLPQFERIFWQVRNSRREQRIPQPATPKRVWFEMKGARSGVRFGLEQQSGGTRTFLNHLPRVLDCLAQGSVMIVDELESNLHPNLAAHLVRLFQRKEANPHGAQLIFTTHNTSLLGSNNETLKRDQIWFIEKNYETGASNLYPLSDFKPRDKENTERRYLGGSYGAVPFIDDDVAEAALQDLGPVAESAK